MIGHRGLLARPWILVMAVAILIAGHGIVLYYVSPFTSLSAAVLTSMVILVVIKHLGLLGALFALFRHRSRH